MDPGTQVVQPQRDVQVLQHPVGQHRGEYRRRARLLHRPRARIRGAVLARALGLELQLPVAGALGAGIVGDVGVRRPGKG